MKTAATQHLAHLDERQFVIAIRRLADSLGYGAQASPFVGSGVDYMQSRLYQAGDAIKDIDWRVTARTGKPFIKEYQAYKRMALYLVVDDSGSMMAGSAEHTKFEWAILLAGALALAGIRQLSPVGMLTCGASQSYDALQVVPSLSESHVYLWTKKLREIEARGESSAKTALGRTLHQIGILAQEKSQVMILSDFHDAGAANAIKPLAQKHEVVALKLQDPAERGGTGGGIFRATEAETQRDFLTTGRSAYQLGDNLKSELKRAGVALHTIRIEENFVPMLRAFLKGN